MVRVTLLQLRTSEDEPTSRRVSRVLRLIEAERDRADLVMLPEMWSVGAFADPDTVTAAAEPLNGQLATSLGQAAKAAGLWLHAGSIPEIVDDALHNTSLLFAPDGQLRATYRKIHLFGFDAGEAAIMTGGGQVVVTGTPLGRTGLSTCYDLRFPELYRELLNLGAGTFLIPAGWPTARIETWELLARARAIENQAFVFACNAAGISGGVSLGGRSLVVGPCGEVLAMADSDEERLSVDVDLTQVARSRAEFPVLADRRMTGPPWIPASAE
ncbi:MAG: carbon-nitrogen family hydrolase [Candidatus Nanopelagicales bacterium]|nr:carbon-nitrogen family hydrolase [Candidatus Nanopelagicales bacterium]MDZ4248923.1 carbon-nitrogen family hydrolase [Candidatus Nanopelagicales bacterium]